MGKIRAAWLLPLLLVIAIKIFSLFPAAVEKYYSQGLYPVISSLQRKLSGWASFSLGDILYSLVILWLILALVRLIREIRKGQTDRSFWLAKAKKSLLIILWVYIAFNLLWGLNYNRKGIVYQLELKTDTISRQDLENIMKQMIVKLQQLDSAAHLNRQKLAIKKDLFSRTIAAYGTLSEKNSAFTYSSPSVKPSLFSYLGNWLGYTGYYNPFSGEAQVNTTVPLFLQPYTSCHEIGHQLGYARENEANFAGYLAAKSSRDPAFRYSVYLDLYNYGRFYLYWQDSMQVKKLDSLLPAGAKKDYKELAEFIRRHRNPVERIIDRLYSQYLKANEQPEGRITYNQVVLWLVAYYKKYGADAL